MITYETYCDLRNAKGLKDVEVARKAGLPPSIFSEWKKGKSTPKIDKMEKIANALEMDYFEFIGPVGKFSSYNPKTPKRQNIKMDPEDMELIKLFHGATKDAQTSVITLLKNSQKNSELSKEA